MKTVIHRAESRGHADHGWLDTHHTFSFGGYRDPERMRFGALRVLNDDVVAPGRGFGSHPHDNMEIVSIPLSGGLEHKDNTGTAKVIRTNDVQIMSAGTGIVHSEFNHSNEEEVNFLQLWVLPKEKDIEPRYDQKTFNPNHRINRIQLVVSPEKNNGTVWINQNAYLSLANFNKGHEKEYIIKSEGNGIYTFLIEGEVSINGETLYKRDGIGAWDVEKLTYKAEKDSEFLIIEIPML